MTTQAELMPTGDAPAKVERDAAPVARRTNPMEILQLAIERGTGVEELGKLMELAERHEANLARQAWVSAMAAFKADPPRIVKDRQVSFGQGKAAYKHATLGNVTDTINSALSLHGLSASWITKQEAGLVTVTCRVTHVQGHFEETSMSAPPDNSGSKNSIQAVGSTVTYLQRYTLLSILGLATYDQDDDGAATSMEYITDKQVGTIVDLIDAHQVDRARLLKYLQVESIETIPAAWFGKVVATIKKKGEAQ